MERDVQLRVVRVLDMVDAEGCDHIGDQCDVQAEQDRPENGTLRYPKLDSRWSRLLITDPHELGPLCQVRPDPIQCATMDSESPVYAGEYRSQSYRKQQRDQEGSGCSEISLPRRDRGR